MTTTLTEAPRKRVVDAERISETEHHPGIDDLIREMRTLVATTGVTYRVAAERILPASMSQRDFRRLAVVGLSVLTADVQKRVSHNELPRDKDERAMFMGRFGTVTEHQKVRDYLAMEDVRRMGVDGFIKPLADFTAKDAYALAEEARAEQVGANKRERWAHELEAMLTKHKAKTWRDLPAKVQPSIEKLAKDAWS